MSLLLALPSAVHAQVDRAVLEGTVTDSTGSVIVGAGIQVVATDTALTENLQTNSKGYYAFPGWQSGSTK